MTALAYTYTRDELALRLSQQELVAAFGLCALNAPALDALMAEACRVAARGLGTQFAKVLRPRPDMDDLLVVAGVGWRPGVVGHATLGARNDSPAGYALHTRTPVLSNNLRDDDRFHVPALLAEHGVQSAINVAIGLTNERPYGVLEVDSTARNEFVAADTTFLQSLANVLAAAVTRHDLDLAAGQHQALARQVFESSPDCVKVLDLDGRLLAMNVNGTVALGIEDVRERIGTYWQDWWPEEVQPLVRAALASARNGSIGRFTSEAVIGRGGGGWWDVLVAPVEDSAGRAERLIAISRNVTERVENERAKDALLRDKDLLMQEVHHRVKNSLQLVRTLLQLQARSASAETRAQLDEAAGRIMTIGAMHQRLYEGGSVTETDAGAYLTALIADMRTMLAGDNGREITLHAEPVMLTADQVTPLGLIVSELVTNAVKYGDGPVKVVVRPVPAGLEVAVEDGGPGFPESFDPGRKTGLGMRLVAALAKGEAAEAIRVDRDAAHSRVVVRITQ